MHGSVIAATFRRADTASSEACARWDGDILLAQEGHSRMQHTPRRRQRNKMLPPLATDSVAQAGTKVCTQLSGIRPRPQSFHQHDGRHLQLQATASGSSAPSRPLGRRKCPPKVPPPYSSDKFPCGFSQHILADGHGASHASPHREGNGQKSESVPCADATLEACSLQWQRPGVSSGCSSNSAHLIQRTWRDYRKHLHLQRAREQLDGTRIELTVQSRMWTHLKSNFQTSGSEQASSKNMSCPGSLQTLSVESGSSGSIWNEAMAYRQPSIDQVVRTQSRWLMISEDPCQQAQLHALCGDASMQIIRDMALSERKLQLRRGPLDTAGPWRPPCAVGAAACAEIESAAVFWQQAAHRDGDVDLEIVLEPCLCLFRLVASSSCLHRRQISRARCILASITAAMDRCPSGSYLCAIGSQLRARIQLQLAFAALSENDFSTAVTAAQHAVELLHNRDGPRDFWPPHCWEFAACYRARALGLAGLRRWGEASEALAKLVPLLSPPSMKAAEPHLVAALHQDIETLKLECEAARQICEGSGDIDSPQALRALQDTARALLTTSTWEQARGNICTVLAKLSLVQELPWYLAGSSRSHVVQEAADHLIAARRGLGCAAVLQKIMPLEVICAVMQGEINVALAHAESWAQGCSASFGCNTDLTYCAQQLVEELQSAQYSKDAQSGRSFQQALSNTLKCVGVGVRDTCDPDTTT